MSLNEVKIGIIDNTTDNEKQKGIIVICGGTPHSAKLFNLLMKEKENGRLKEAGKDYDIQLVNEEDLPDGIQMIDANGINLHEIDETLNPKRIVLTGGFGIRGDLSGYAREFVIDRSLLQDKCYNETDAFNKNRFKAKNGKVNKAVMQKRNRRFC